MKAKSGSFIPLDPGEMDLAKSLHVIKAFFPTVLFQTIWIFNANVFSDQALLYFIFAGANFLGGSFLVKLKKILNHQVVPFALDSQCKAC